MASNQESDSKLVVFAAAGANFLIAIAKFVGAALTGSAAMASEGIHSVIDTCNEFLLLLGLSRAKRPADRRHPYGHGKEIYFWGLMVAMLLFAIGGGMSVLEGLRQLFHTEPPHSPTVDYLILGVAFLFEGASWLISYRKLRKRRTGGSLFSAWQQSKDPSVYSVMAEDTAALAGLVVAFLGIFVGHTFGIRQADPIASIVIGVLLAVTAFVLATETKALLVGESASPEIVEDIRLMVTADPNVRLLKRVLTMHLAPEQVLLNLQLEFRPGISSSDAAEAMDRIEKAVREKHPEMTKVFIDMEPFSEAVPRPPTGKPGGRRDGLPSSMH